MIAVIIPAINEAPRIKWAVESAVDGGAAETIVVDGGSTDDTRKIAQQVGAIVLTSGPGRALQMNVGANASQSPILLFLHADNRLPLDFSRQIKSCVENLGARAGVFSQRIDHASWKYRVLGWGNKLRVRLRGLAYGDQGIWVQRELFNELGGFPLVPIMEDYIFSLQIRKKTRYHILKGPLVVDARRWESRGVLAQTWLNWKIIRDFRSNKSLDELAKKYRRHDQ